MTNNDEVAVKSRVKNPFVMCPRKLLNANNITEVAFKMWIYLESHAEKFNPTTETMVGHFGRSKNTILNAKQELINFNMISIEEIAAKHKGSAVRHVLYVNDPDDWKNMTYNEREPGGENKPIKSSVKKKGRAGAKSKPAKPGAECEPDTGAKNEPAPGSKSEPEPGAKSEQGSNRKKGEKSSNKKERDKKSPSHRGKAVDIAKQYFDVYYMETNGYIKDELRDMLIDQLSLLVKNHGVEEVENYARWFNQNLIPREVKSRKITPLNFWNLYTQERGQVSLDMTPF